MWPFKKKPTKEGELDMHDLAASFDGGIAGMFREHHKELNRIHIFTRSSLHKLKSPGISDEDFADEAADAMRAEPRVMENKEWLDFVTMETQLRLLKRLGKL